MKKIKITGLILLIAFILTGCGMTNDEIIAETKKCEEAGLDYEYGKNDVGWVMKVQCKKSELEIKQI